MRKLSTLESIRDKFADKAWKKELRTLKLSFIERTAPGFFKGSGGYDMQINPYSDTTSNGLTRAVCDWITYSGGDAQRINTQGQLRNIGGEKKWTYSGSRKGAADIHAIIRGRAVSIEIKIGKDRQSDDQKKEQERIERAGGIYFVAKDMTSFVDWYKTTFENNNL